MDEHTENVTVDDSYIEPWQVQWWIGLLELFVFIIGTPMNLAVFYLTHQSKRRSNNGLHKNTITEMFIISMASADLLFCSIHAPMMYLNYNRGIDLSPIPCLTLFAVTHASTVASSLSLVCLNFNKFLHLHRPLHYFLYITRWRAIFLILIGWSASIGWGLFFVLGPFVQYDWQCNLYLQHKSVYVVFATVFFLLPTIVSLLISIYVAVVVVETKKHATQPGLMMNGQYSTRCDLNARLKNPRSAISRDHNWRNFQRRRAMSPTYWPSPNRFIVMSSSARRMAHIRRISFVFTTTIWSALTTLPYRLAFIVNNLPKPHDDGQETRASNIANFVYFCLFAVMTLNAAGNPFITILTQRQYSAWLKCVWRKLIGSLKSAESNHPTARHSFPTTNETSDADWLRYPKLINNGVRI